MNSEEKRKKIAIIFISSKWNPAYSICSVVQSQIRMLAGTGYRLEVITKKDCPKWKFAEKVSYKPCLSSYSYHSKKHKKGFLKKVRTLEKELLESLEDCDIVINHDGLFLYQFIHYNLAIRNAAKKLKNIKWIHWAHSSPLKPSKKKRFPWNFYYSGMKNSVFVTVAESHAKNFARMYNIPLERVRTVHNARVCKDYLQFSKAGWKIIEKGRLLEADIVVVFPTDLARATKQPEIILFIVACLKEIGKKAKVVFVDSFQSNDKVKGTAQKLKFLWLAEKLGLEKEDILFTSDASSSLKKGCPAKVVRELLSISNVFIHPSISEACSLTLIEAAVSKNLCVLNKNVKSFAEIAGKNALYYAFPNLSYEMQKLRKNGKKTSEFSETIAHFRWKKAFYKKIAKDIIKCLEKDKSMALFSKVKKEFSEKAVFESQMTPLLEGIVKKQHKQIKSISKKAVVEK